MTARDKISAARLRVWRRFPWFHALLFDLRPVEVAGMGSISVDEGLRLYYDPGMIDSLNVEEVESLLAHEVQHPLRRHAPRERAATHLRSRHHRVRYECAVLFGATTFGSLCNVAGDCEINDDLFGRVGMKMPGGKYEGVMPATFKMPDGKTLEEYVVLMLEQAEKLQQQGGPSEQGQSVRGGNDDAPQSSGEGESEGEAGQRSGEDGGGASDQAPGEGGGGAGDDARDANPEGRRGDGPSDGGSGPEEATDEAAPSGEGDAGSSGSAPDSGPSRPSVVPRCGHGACGGSAGQTLDHERVERPDAPLPATAHEVARALQQVAHAVLEHLGANSRGTVPGGWLTEWAKSMLAPPKVNPYRVLAAATRSAIAGTQRGNMDFTNGPLSRRREVVRQLVGNRAPLMSVMRGPNPRVVFVVDTSGSMGGGKDSRLSHALAESMNIAKQCQATPLGLAVDAAVHEVRPIRSVNDILALARGGGGTDMRVGIAAAADPKHRADVIVLLTDGETPWPTLAEMPRKAALVTVIINRNTPKEVGCPPHVMRSVVHVDTER